MTVIPRTERNGYLNFEEFTQKEASSLCVDTTRVGLKAIPRTERNGYLNFEEFTQKEVSRLCIDTTRVSPEESPQEPGTPKVTKFLEHLFPEKNQLISSGAVFSLYHNMMEQRDSWELEHRKTIRIGSKSDVILTYKLPDRSTRHCFSGPEKVIGFYSPGEALVIDAQGDTEHGVRHEI